MKLQLPFEFDAGRLRADLNLVEDDEWIAHYNPKDHKGVWEVAALMSPAGMQTSTYACSIPDICRATPLMQRCSYFASVLEQIPVQSSSVRLMKLAAGAVIKEHSDSFAEEQIRVHIPVRTNSGVEFSLQGEKVQMVEGSCWYLDFRLPHRVRNLGNESRTHMVIDGFRNSWFEECLASSVC